MEVTIAEIVFAILKKGNPFIQNVNIWVSFNHVRYPQKNAQIMKIYKGSVFRKTFKGLPSTGDWQNTSKGYVFTERSAKSLESTWVLDQICEMAAMDRRSLKLLLLLEYLQKIDRKIFNDRWLLKCHLWSYIFQIEYLLKTEEAWELTIEPSKDP